MRVSGDAEGGHDPHNDETPDRIDSPRGGTPTAGSFVKPKRVVEGTTPLCARGDPVEPASFLGARSPSRHPLLAAQRETTGAGRFALWVVPESP